ncbi:MAG TPA: YggS family pyridoxal phosphate-dependent enzyme [Candidatus Limnocylindria bacterium]|nr:YggS family pyridoxal phosphate-dependent enzyme [Candidatus Limnocylindria bacterium]
MHDEVAARLAAVRQAVAAAARRAGRDPAAVRIVAVTKTLPPAAVAAALAAGLTDIGENYVQEARAKRAAVAAPAAWHLIGGLQRNKVRAAVGLFDRVHTVDSALLADALAAEGGRAGRSPAVLIQVNVGGERTKRGVPPERVEEVAKAILRHPELRLEGLMAIPPPPARPEASRPYFRALRELRDHAQTRLGVELPHLSMGMSDDFPVAVEEGATFLRLGRALFGGRGPGASRPGSSVGGEGS